jgi:hypothetical protein
VVVQSAAVLAHAMKDGMEALVQGISGALKASADGETTVRLDCVEKGTAGDEASTYNRASSTIQGSRLGLFRRFLTA